MNRSGNFPLRVKIFLYAKEKKENRVLLIKFNN